MPNRCVRIRTHSGVGGGSCEVSLYPEFTSKNTELLWEIYHEFERKRTGCGTKQFEKEGGFDEALEDFGKMGLTGVKDASTGEKIVKIGKLPDGRIVNVRNKSEDSRPTLEVYDGKKSVKIRYGSK